MNSNEPEENKQAEATEAVETATEETAETTSTAELGGAEAVLKKAAEDMAKWFVIHSQTGHEARVKTALEQRILSLGMEHKIFQVGIPTREIVVVKKGKKTNQNVAWKDTFFLLCD